MTRRALALMVAVLLLLACVAQAQIPLRWSMANEYPATSIQGEADARFAREIAERTKGRIEIAHQYDAASGVRSRDMLAAIASGKLVIGNTFMGALGAVDPVFQLPSLPFLASAPEQGKALAEIARPAYERALEPHNQKLLFLSPWPAAGLWARKPIDSVEALKGLRVRTSDASGVLVFKTAGAVPVEVSFADAIPMLKAGQLDALVSSGDGGAGARFAETLKHFTAIEYAITMSMVTVNGDAWRALDPELRRAVLAAAAATEAAQWEILKTRVAANYAQFRAAGVTVTTALPPDYRQALSAAAQVAIDDWKQKMGPAAGPILDDYRKRLEGR
jgi:TRAP-type C4-dicarboxylate transport system substrate-binding protein